MNDNSCKDCQDRTADCHSTCSKYQAYREALAERKRKHDEATRIDKEMTGYHINRAKARDRSRRKKL